MKHLVTPIVTAMAASTLSFNALSAEIKNVILMIGDGMGPQQVGLLETYANHAPNSIYQGETTALYKLCLLYTSPSPRDGNVSRMPSSA